MDNPDQDPNGQPANNNVQPNVIVVGNQPQNNAINRVQVKVPPFWKKNPQLWFKQLEAQFANSNIVNDLTKFNAIVGVIESDILSFVSDIVLAPPVANMYELIKARLISEFTDSDQKKLKGLLLELTLGDMKPSTLLRKMKELSCNKVSDELLQTLWLQRLPHTIQTVLSTSTDDLDHLATMADTMHEVAEASSIQAVSTTKCKEIDDLVNVVHKLEGKIESLNKVFRESKKSNGRTSQDRSPTHAKASSTSNKNLCYYHKYYGTKAIKCKKPCSFKASKPKN